MKTKLVFILLLAVLFGTVFISCGTTPDESPAIVPESLVGTKWDWVMSHLGIRNTIEFIDESKCIYTLATGPKEFAYTVNGNKVTVENSTYELRGDTMYYKGNPHFVKMSKE